MSNDREILEAVRDARPDLAIVGILPQSAEDGPYMRTFRLEDGGIAMLRRPDVPTVPAAPPTISSSWMRPYCR